MDEHYVTVNIHSYLDKLSPSYLGEKQLLQLFSTFHCPNPDVMNFLLHSAIEFAKKEQSVTYLVFRSSDSLFVGYYSLALKPLIIKTEQLSRNMQKKIARVGSFHSKDNSFLTCAYLIAQLGKNFAIPKEKRIDGNELIDIALYTIRQIQHAIGGIVTFLECECNNFLIEFYTRNQFKFFDIRESNSPSSNSPHKLNQFLRLL